MISNDLKEVKKILKRNGVKPELLAEVWATDSTYVSKVLNGRKNLTKDNFDLFNKKFGHIVKLHPDLLKKVITLESFQAIVDAQQKRISALESTVAGLRELLLRHHEKIHNVSDIEARQTLGRITEDWAKKHP